MHQPVTGWRHDRPETMLIPDCLPYMPSPGTLMFYDPASTSGDTWIHTDRPLDLRSWA